MSKSLKYLLIILPSAFILLWFIMRLTNILNFYNIPVSSNLPTISPGDKIITSNLVKPGRFDFICFSTQNQEGNNETRVYRLCGLEGDVVEIKDGTLYVNKKNADEDLSLAQEYILPATEHSRFEDMGLDESMMQVISKDSMHVYFSERFMKENKIPSRRVILEKSSVDEYIKARHGGDWNQDHFGPVTVPKDSYFVLGDNRHACEDSRYLGFISRKSVTGTVIGGR